MQTRRKRVTELSNRQRALVAASRGELQSMAIPHRQDGSPPPLSFAQERLWFLEQLEPGVPIYNVPSSMVFSGSFSVVALEKAWCELLRRHESLRTTFRVIDGRPVQIIDTDFVGTLAIDDLRWLKDNEKALRLRKIARVEQDTPFELDCGPLARARVIRLTNDQTMLLTTLHHIVSDGWSMGILRRELRTLYESFSDGRPSPLPELPLQYADYALWQRQSFENGRLEESIRFWIDQLRSAPAAIDLPTDHPRPDVQRFDGATQTFLVPAAIVQPLERLAKDQSCTLFMALLSVFYALLFRYTGQTDISVGTPVANRGHVELEPLIGFFANTLVLRADLSGTPTFLELLNQVREVTLAAYTHQEVPFERVVEELHPQRNLAHNPLFQVMFALQNIPVENLNIDTTDLQDGPSAPEMCKSKFELSLFCREIEGGLLASLEYRTDLFNHDRMRAMICHFLRLVQEFGSKPSARIGEIKLIEEIEESGLLALGQTCMSDSVINTAGLTDFVHMLVVRQGKLDPEAIAIEYRGRSVTYGALLAKSGGLAIQLQEASIGSESRVGIWADRSVESMIAVLAVLRAGAAYVPLDASYPLQRLQFIVEDAELSALIVHDAQPGQLPLFNGLVLSVDTSQTNAEPTEPNLSSANLLYVLYTSGSTGRPKGVAMTHGVAANLVRWQLSDLPCRARTLQFAPQSFDVSFQEVFSTWSGGGTLVLVDEDTRRDPLLLLDYLHNQQIERLFLPPLMLRELSKAASTRGAPPFLKEVITAGEALLISDAVVDFFEQLPNARLYNHYGPTETHVVTSMDLEEEPRRWASTPSIGRPIAGVEIYLLDTAMHLTPMGVTGELYIGGEAVSRGYLNSPSATAERYVPNPYGKPGDRLYRTSDIARWNTRGLLEFLGRNDQQLKIRGFRVEPGEVEVLLQKHPQVEAAYVLAVETLRGTLLAGYVTVCEATSAKDIRRWLAERVPHYLVPNVVVLLDQMPTTSSGKVARRLLPPISDEHFESQEQYEPPADELQIALAEIWSEVLGIDKVGIKDDFFDLGGHSLLATQVVSRIGTRFGVPLAVRSLFESPTIEALSCYLSEITTAPASPALVPVSLPSVNQVDDLSDEEVDALLRQYFTEVVP